VCVCCRVSCGVEFVTLVDAMVVRV